jgi:DNA (cytosine-5)-methyltransferase 1
MVEHHRGEYVRFDGGSGAYAPAAEDLDAIRRWVKGVRGPTAIDLFAGAGGLSLGLQDAGFTMLLGADNDAHAARTHHHNIGGLSYTGDLSETTELRERLDAWGITCGTVDLVAGGVPCQPFSRAGKNRIRHLVRKGGRTEADPRAELWISFVEIIDHLRPRAVLLENVPDLAMWDDGELFIGICENLRELGYRVDAKILDTFEYGVPQHRARLIVVALRDAFRFEWPTPLGARNTLRDAIGDLPIVPGGERVSPRDYDGTPETELQKRLRRDVPPSEAKIIHDHVTRAVRPDDARAFAHLKEGQTYADLPDDLQRYRSDIFTDRYKRLSWDELSRTITAHIAKDGYWYIHPVQDRTLSIREAARVQTFPDAFRFAGTPSHRFRQIGNAVPPLFAEAIGRSLMDALQGVLVDSDDEPSTAFRRDLLDWHDRHPGPRTWRAGTADAWTVLIAEVLLSRATPKRISETLPLLPVALPDARAVCADPERALRKLAEMGFAGKSDELLTIARHLVEHHDGLIPSRADDLAAIPGLGDFLAKSVRTFAFGDRAVPLDRATSRAMARINGHEDTGRWQIRLDYYGLAGGSGPDAPFNHALLELTRTVCTVERPRCGSCPVRLHCALGRQAEASETDTISAAVADG